MRSANLFFFTQPQEMFEEWYQAQQNTPFEEKEEQFFAEFQQIPINYGTITDTAYQDSLYWKEQHLYGSSRLGIAKPELEVTNYTPSNASSLTTNFRNYELTNHLGNAESPESLRFGILSTVKDEPILTPEASLSPSNEVAFTKKPLILTAQDYYPFGMIMPNRSFSLAGSGYRFGFNTQEKDDEVYGKGNLMTADYWEYDTRIGRRWNTDPEEEIFPWQSPYVSLVNNPIVFVDDEGDIPWYYVLKFKNGTKVTSISNVGMRLHPIHKKWKMHKGNDLRSPVGTPVRAFASGTIIATEYEAKGAGYYIKIQHQSGYITKYFHLEKGSFKVKVGDKVEDGQEIANSGNTGGSKGPHLHIETWKGNKFYNASDIGDLQQRINNELVKVQQKIFKGYTCSNVLIIGKRQNVSKNEGSTNNDLNQNSSNNSSSNSSNNNSSNDDEGNEPRFISPRYVNQ